MKGLPVPGAEGTYLHNRRCPLHKQVFFTKGGIYGLLLVSAGARWLLAQTCPCAKELYFRVANAGTSQILRGFVAASAFILSRFSGGFASLSCKRLRVMVRLTLWLGLGLGLD